MSGVYGLLLRVLSFRRPRPAEPAAAPAPAPAPAPVQGPRLNDRRPGETSGERRLRVLRAIQGDLRRRPSGSWRAQG
jgi:hypothetical protein